MTVNLQLGASVKDPEPGDIFVDDRDDWASTGYFRLVFIDSRYDGLRTIPLVFAHSLKPSEFIPKCSSFAAPKYIMPVAHVELKK